MGRFHDDFRSRIGKRALKLLTLLSCTYVRNDLFGILISVFNNRTVQTLLKS